jgi:hypothetical protein
MLKKFLITLGLGLVSLGGVQAAEFKKFMPENNAKNYEWEFRSGGITEQQFNDIIDVAVEIYAPIAKANGEEFVYNKLFSDPTVNSDACRGCESGKVIINAYGGLARENGISVESYALVGSHEISHLYANKYADSTHKAVVITGSDHMYAESNADFQGNGSIETLILKGLMKKGYAFNLSTTTLIDTKCAAKWDRSSEGYQLCVIRLNAGNELGTILANLGGEAIPSYDQRDKLVVKKTNQSYPSVQCRLDNYFDSVFNLNYSKCWFKN